MTPAEAKEIYLRQIRMHGEVVTIRRYAGTGNTRTHVDYGDIGARVVGYDPSELVGGIVQGDRKVILLAADVIASAIPLPIVKGDRLIIRGNEHAVEVVDDSTRRIAGELVAIELRVNR